MAHIMPASWQHWSKTLQSSKHTFKASGKVHTSKTLFLAQVPSHAGTEELQALAKPLPGYVPFSARRVRGMAFLDFESKQHATDALSKLQGHTWKAGEKGLLVSYDKDDEEDRGGTARRQMEELRRRREELEASYTRLHCAACGSFACKVVVDLEKLPLRRTDGSRVVGSAQLMALDCAKGAAKKIKREKGIEKQYYLNCVQCDVTLAYRSTPFGTPGKYVYLIAKALRARTTEEGKRDRVEKERYRHTELPPNARPGDWLCTHKGCGGHNYASRTHCFQCGAEKMEQVDTAAAAAIAAMRAAAVAAATTGATAATTVAADDAAAAETAAAAPGAKRKATSQPQEEGDADAAAACGVL